MPHAWHLSLRCRLIHEHRAFRVREGHGAADLRRRGPPRLDREVPDLAGEGEWGRHRNTDPPNTILYSRDVNPARLEPGGQGADQGLLPWATGHDFAHSVAVAPIHTTDAIGVGFPFVPP